jgi:hypothetical protein
MSVRDSKEVLKAISTYLALGAAGAGIGVAISHYTFRPSLDNELTELRRTARESQDLQTQARTTVQSIRALTSSQLNVRLEQLLFKTDQLEKQVISLQQIINPNNAPDILTTARMRDEILARGKFEEAVKASLKETNQNVSSIHTWMLSIAGTIIAGLLTFAWFLLRRTTVLYDYVRSLEAAAGKIRPRDTRPEYFQTGADNPIE